jgi:hypothetical protein
MKIRFYHWWLYSLFRWAWNPIFVEYPHMATAFISFFQLWADSQEPE